MFFEKITCGKLKNVLSLQCDFFIVLDLRLTKIGWQACQPFAFYSGCVSSKLFGFFRRKQDAMLLSSTFRKPK